MLLTATVEERVLLQAPQNGHILGPTGLQSELYSSGSLTKTKHKPLTCSQKQGHGRKIAIVWLERLS